MGNSYTKEEEQEIVSSIFSLAQKSGLMPDIGIDVSLMKYSGLNSAAVLQVYSSELLGDLNSKAPDYITNLGAALTAFECVPNAVGLGALIVSLMLDHEISSTPAESSDRTLHMMRRVFGEEKASDVRDCMDEYMKRISMYMNEPLMVLEETERLEKQLSEQLTRLRNSMLHDNQMTSRSMKHWTNGAAFHVQMLIHAARLKMAVSCDINLQDRVESIKTVVLFYQRDLQELMINYKAYKRSTITLKKTKKFIAPGHSTPKCIVQDDEFGLHAVYDGLCYAKSLDAYVDYMFNNWSQLDELKNYFADLEKNIRDLILQHEAFKTKHLSSHQDLI